MSSEFLNRLRDYNAGEQYRRPIRTDRWGLQVTSQPALEPVTLDEAKAYMRVDINTEDALITALIVSARSMVELHLRRALIEQTLELTYDSQPEQDFIELPRPPMISLESVEYFGDDDLAQAFDITELIADASKSPAVLRLKRSSVWPVSLRPQASLVFEYKAGYGTAASSVPGPIKTAIMTIVAAWFEQRGQMEQMSSSQFGDLSRIPPMALAMLAPYKVHTL